MNHCSGIAIGLALGLALATSHCQPWDEVPPPSSAAAAAAAAPSAVAAPSPSAPERAPRAQPPTQPSSDTSDVVRYASPEYAVGTDDDSYDDTDPSALSDFREALEPYGAWSDDPKYGTIWVPSPGAVGADFAPYVSAGHWAYDDDYVWVSDYPWGWAPFHYGRWVLAAERGWAWIPGRAYRGASVTWSVDATYGYLGWAPAPPDFVWFGGVAVAWHGYWEPRWAYIARRDVFAPDAGARVVTGPAAIRVATRMRPYAPDAGASGGPPPARFGYDAAKVRPGSAPGVLRAQAFARPSTARFLGGAPPARVPSAALPARVGPGGPR